MKRRAFLGLGASSIGIGTLYGTGAFSAVSAGRGISVNAADDPNALVALEIADSVASNSAGERLVTVTNNFGDTLDVTVELTEQAAADGTISLVDGVLSLGAGGIGNVYVNLDEPNPNTAEITFDVTAVTDAASVTLSRGGVGVTNPGGGGGGNNDGPANFAIGDLALEDGTFTQDLSFDAEALGNNNSVTIDLSDAQTVGADYSMASVEIVDGPKASTLELDTDTYEIAYSPQGNSKGILTLRISGVEVDGNGGTATATYDDGDRTDEDTFTVPAVGRDGNSIDTSGSGIVPDGETIDEAEVGGDLDMGDGTTANNEVDAGGNLTSGDGAVFHGEVEGGGNADLGSGTTVNNGIEVDGNLTIGDDSIVNGELNAGGGVTLGERTEVNNGLEATGDVVVGADSVVNGELETDGDVYLCDGVELNDDVDADTIYEGCNVTIDDEVDGQQVDDCQ